MDRNQTTVALWPAGFRAILIIAIFDTLAAFSLTFGALWQSPSFSTAITALAITGAYVLSLVTVLRRTYTRRFLVYFTVMTVVLVISWAIVIVFMLNKNLTTLEALAILFPVSIVVGGIAQILARRPLSGNKRLQGDE